MRPIAGMLVLSVGLGLVLIALWFWPMWPLAVMGGILAASALIERRYRRSSPAAGPWQPTNEKFVDDESGRIMQVWYNPETGQRDYRPLDEPQMGQ